MKKCRNCGAEESIHRYDTNQCPVQGREAYPVAHKLCLPILYVFDESDEIFELIESIRVLIERVAVLEKALQERSSFPQ